MQIKTTVNAIYCPDTKWVVSYPLKLFQTPKLPIATPAPNNQTQHEHEQRPPLKLGSSSLYIFKYSNVLRNDFSRLETANLQIKSETIHMDAHRNWTKLFFSL